MRIDLKTGLKKSDASEKNLKKVLTEAKRFALMGGLFKFKRASSNEAASEKRKASSLEVEKTFFEKNKKFRKKVLTTENEIALMGGLFKFKRAASKEAASGDGEREKFFEIY